MVIITGGLGGPFSQRDGRRCSRGSRRATRRGRCRRAHSLLGDRGPLCRVFEACKVRRVLQFPIPPACGALDDHLGPDHPAALDHFVDSFHPALLLQVGSVHRADLAHPVTNLQARGHAAVFREVHLPCNCANKNKTGEDLPSASFFPHFPPHTPMRHKKKTPQL